MTTNREQYADSFVPIYGLKDWRVFPALGAGNTRVWQYIDLNQVVGVKQETAPNTEETQSLLRLRNDALVAVALPTAAILEVLADWKGQRHFWSPWF